MRHFAPIVSAERSAPPKVESRLSALRPGRTDPLVIDERTGAGRFSAGLLAVMRGCLHLNEALNPRIAVVHVQPVPRRAIGAL